MATPEMPAHVHPSADVDEGIEIGDGTRVWHLCQIRRGARIGKGCVLGRGVFVDADVRIGDNCKIQNYACVYQGVELADGVFVGPHACFTNDKMPRAINPDGTGKGPDDWIISRTRVEYGAAIGANATVVCGTVVGRWAVVAAGSVVTKDVPDHAIVAGSPARVRGWICGCGQRHEDQERARACCPVGGA